MPSESSESIDDAVTHYLNLKPRQFNVINRLGMQWNEDGELEIDLTLQPHEVDTRFLQLNFRGVTRLKLNSDNNLSEFSYLDIWSLRDRGWEYLKYQVSHAEQDLQFSFYCADFTAHTFPMPPRVEEWYMPVRELAEARS